MVEERESWGSHIEFFLSSLGLAVGLGNVWRFPYIAFDNGGGSFLIPYCLALVFVGLPAFFMELSAGQYARVGANKVWGRMAPAFKGLGYGMILVRFLVNIYYVVICGWCFIYLVVGMRTNLPWAGCGDFESNTYGCYTKQLDEKCRKDNQTYFNGTCIEFETFCEINNQTYNIGEDAEDTCNGIPFGDLYDRVSPADDYYYRVVLGLKKDYQGTIHTFEDYGGLKWELVLALFVSWVMICLILIKGLKSLGKASYVITLSPYVVLTALLAYGAGREGAVEGISQFFTPDWNVYTSGDSYEVWALAASQILFSLSVGFGSQLVLSSYNEVTNNCHRKFI
ncbi:sodium-dependent serotonin transporter [Eurytemora carolleeae]|uniref:sodium-dependent serotonin transporter n=1 Tax=Eurytemora carolleeae TaxID=1294199 RepID=UPI000C76F56C|nr:sodium-dependent serotonin transporter [Eurytemora carolleeae]|eukprot:XP_023324600.1 sodium-dependent serotonin transporter-like [Eurytemora affinis]